MHLDLLTYATLKVIIDTLAWLNAVITVGGDAPEDEFKSAMNVFKEETGRIIEDVVQQIIDEQDEQDEKGEEE